MTLRKQIHFLPSDIFEIMFAGSVQALMLAAAVDSVIALQVLLKNGATVELQVLQHCLFCSICLHRSCSDEADCSRGCKPSSAVVTLSVLEECIVRFLLRFTGMQGPVIGALLQLGNLLPRTHKRSSQQCQAAGPLPGVRALRVVMECLRAVRRDSQLCVVISQDALGRTALMFAAGSGAVGALKALLDAGASLAARDRRGKGILDYAPPESPVRTILEDRSALFNPPVIALTGCFTCICMSDTMHLFHPPS